MAEQLAACAQELFEGQQGSEAQHSANAWLMQFQFHEEAWHAALQLLQQPVYDPITHRPLAAPQLVAMQILRLKTQCEWTCISTQQQQIVRQTVLKLLEMTCGTENGLSPVSRRIACVTLADIVVKSCRNWTSWKSDVQRLVDVGTAAQRQQKGAAMLADVLGAIPLQILASESAWTAQEMQQMLEIFQVEGDNVMTVVQMILASIPDERISALRCLESWIVGCVPTHEAFGLNASHLFARGLLDELFNAAISDNEELAHLAAGIIADSFARNASAVGSENMTKAVLRSGYRLVEAIPLFQSDMQFPTGNIMTKEQQTNVCRGMSRIACSLAMNHASVLFLSQTVGTQASLDSLASKQQQRFSYTFLELLLACSSYDDIDVAQPTLEIWFFFLEDSPSQNEMSWQIFLDTTGLDYVVSVLTRLVNALIERCKYPQWFIDRHQIVSDDPEIEAIADFRREIADTVLSLFSKWPRGHGEPAGDYASCVKDMCQMLSDCKDVALIDALFFLLSHTVELFDAISSDSGSENDSNSCQIPISSGIDVLVGVFDYALNLPMHLLVSNGVARYLRSLGASHALPPSVYLRASMIICQGLHCASSFPVAIQSLLHSSSSIAKCTTIEERAPLLQALLQFSTTFQTITSQNSKGDLLEVTFRIARGLSDADFGTLCSSILSNLTVRVQSTNSIEASSVVYMLGRAFGGIQDDHGFVLIEQLWPLVKASLLQHRMDGTCRREGARFFLNAIPHLPKEAPHPIEVEMLEMCLWWYGGDIAPDILTCCSRIILRQRGNVSMQSSAEHAFEQLLAGFRKKLYDVAGTESGALSMESFLSQRHEAEKMIPEVQQFLELAREVLSSFPQALLRNRSNGEPSLYWICVDLATRLMKVDHQMQEICDAACDFLLSAMRCQPEQILVRINIFAVDVVRAVLVFLGPKRQHYCARHLWDFLFQCLHASQISTQIRDGFLSAVSTVVSEEGVLRSLFSADVCQQIPGELRVRCQRHRFRLYFTRLAHLAEAAYS
ncbi:unnamed protein product [Peronospora belbahrii]|uniref:Importin N-terminal domain-containing protein n=1 Tax=Peronospora belbahrii TaxID=622444 RepID=A0ABN8D0Q8_9STRA|nr:unnamed protein product [Peronospora belbahrii]